MSDDAPRRTAPVRTSLSRTRRPPGLDTPREVRRRLPAPRFDPEMFGRWSESFARYMGTAWFIVGMTVFVAVWLLWNTYGPQPLQFDPRALNYTLLTLILSLQASYAAPLILLAQNRQADRDRVALEQDRQRAERNLADTEYLAREVAALRIALRDVATRDFVRGELRDLLAELQAELTTEDDDGGARPASAARGKDARSGKDRSGKDGRSGKDRSGKPAKDRPRHRSAPASPDGSTLSPDVPTHPA